MQLEKTAYEIGLMPEEFWRLTIGEFLGIVDGFNKRREYDRYNVAVILAAIYNTIRNPKKQKEPFKPEDFLPKKKTKQKDLLKQAESLNEIFGGTDSRKAVD